MTKPKKKKMQEPEEMSIREDAHALLEEHLMIFQNKTETQWNPGSTRPKFLEKYIYTQQQILWGIY